METAELSGDDFGMRFSHPAISAFYDYWRGLPHERGLPGRHHVDPLAIPSLLQWLLLIDIEALIPKAKFRYRLAGTGVVRLFGREFTGLTDSEAFPNRAAQLTSDYLSVVNQRSPVYDHVSVPTPGREYRSLERLMCPLAADGQTINMLIGIVCAPR